MGVKFIPDTKETRYKLQQLARLKMITKLEADILMDIEVCEVEGWDKTEYVNQLKTVVNSYGTADRKDEPQYHADVECNYKDCDNCGHKDYCPQSKDEPKTERSER